MVLYEAQNILAYEISSIIFILRSSTVEAAASRMRGSAEDN